MERYGRGRRGQYWLAALAMVLFTIQSVQAEEEKSSSWAVVNGRNISEGDLTALNNGQTARTMQNQVYQARKQALEAFITDQLIEQEAKKRSIARDQLVKQEVDDKIPEPADAEIEQVYTSNKERLGGKPLAEAKPTIVTFLKGQKRQAQMQSFVRTLRRAANVKLLLKPPSLNVTLEGAPVRGSANAPVTIVEFSDFQCPYCARVQPDLVKIRETYKDKVKIVFKDYPLEFHANARKAAEASRCAAEQGKYWEYHDVLFANGTALELANLKKFAENLKLDATQFSTCLDSGKHAASISKDMAEGTQAGVTGTPAFFVNGRFLSGAQPFASFQDAIEEALEQ